MPISGGCLCGKVRYQIAAEAPLRARVCWCRVCQYMSAGGGTVNAIFPKEAIRVTGETAVYSSVADSGAVLHRRFCASCGVHLFSEAEPRPHLVVVRVGSLDNPEIGKPSAIIWTRSAPNWACYDPTLPQSEGQPT
jgi:hypothetical protein